jgi:hypothetical protein
MIKSCETLLRTRNVSAKGAEKVKTHILGSVTFFLKIVPFMWKRYCTAGQATDGSIIHGRKDAVWMWLAQAHIGCG